MLRTIAIVSALVVSALAQGSASASTITGVQVTSTASQAMPAVATAAFNPAEVNSTLAYAWCRAQQNTCPDICGGLVSTNYCNSMTFTYNCVCANGTVPDCTAFEQTLPYFICQQTYIQCIASHPSTDPSGQQQCMNNEQCGTRNATAERAAASSSSSTMTATSSASASGSSASSTASHGAAVAVTPASTGAFAALLLALCRLVL